MSNFASNVQHPRRSFSARAEACRVAAKFMKGGTPPRDAERNEHAIRLEQTADMLDRFASSPGFAAEIGKLMERTV